MSVTKSFLSALVGIAIDRGLIRNEDESVADALPRNAFANDADFERFRGVTIRDVLGMSALDSPVLPHQTTPEAIDRLKRFNASRNRLQFALNEKLLPEPGKSFLYTDVTPELAVGIVSLSAHESAFDFARENLFDPLGFKNEEWMHEDDAGFDYGAVGLRVRPIDMQKFGVLYLRHGVWNGKRIVSEAWTQKSFSPWIRSAQGVDEPNYGSFWWTQKFGTVTAHVANGWKGQRIAVVPEKDLVVTMTAAIEENEEANFRRIMVEYVLRATRDDAARGADPDADARLRAALDDTRENARFIDDHLENRLVPSVAPKENHHPLAQ